MNAIDTALRHIRFTIPNEILDLAFNNYADVTHRMISLDERIRNTIIIGKVWRDCNIVGGTQLVINLEKCKLTYIDRGEFIIDVPNQPLPYFIYFRVEDTPEKVYMCVFK